MRFSYYLVPTGFNFTSVTTLREAKRLAREHSSSPYHVWFEGRYKNGTETPGTGNANGITRFTFNGKKWRK